MQIKDMNSRSQVRIPEPAILCNDQQGAENSYYMYM